MCGRTSRAVDPDVLEHRFDAQHAPGVDIPQRYNIAPSEDLVAIQNDAPEELDMLEWGFIPEWADEPDDAPTPINARSETAAEKPMFREVRGAPVPDSRRRVLQVGMISRKHRRRPQ